jgi:hypothetical protein
VLLTCWIQLLLGQGVAKRSGSELTGVYAAAA